MKSLITFLVVVFGLQTQAQTRYPRPLHMSCKDTAIQTQYGVLDVQLEIFRKGDIFDTILIARKNNQFALSMKQRSWTWSSADADIFIPDGNVIQIGEDGKEHAWEGARLAITQVMDSPSSAVVVVQFESDKAPNAIVYTTRNCR